MRSKPTAIALTETWCKKNTNEKAWFLMYVKKNLHTKEQKRWGERKLIKKQHEYQIMKWTTNITDNFLVKLLSEGEKMIFFGVIQIAKIWNR